MRGWWRCFQPSWAHLTTLCELLGQEQKKKTWLLARSKEQTCKYLITEESNLYLGMKGQIGIKFCCHWSFLDPLLSARWGSSEAARVYLYAYPSLTLRRIHRHCVSTRETDSCARTWKVNSPAARWAAGTSRKAERRGRVWKESSEDEPDRRHFILTRTEAMGSRKTEVGSNHESPESRTGIYIHEEEQTEIKNHVRLLQNSNSGIYYSPN